MIETKTSPQFNNDLKVCHQFKGQAYRKSQNFKSYLVISYLYSIILVKYAIFIII